MKISKALNLFYLRNNLPADGGQNDKYFYLKFKLFTMKLPNLGFRKNVVYIHDIQHILFDCDITWKGESFIAGWEIGTDMWKKLPIGMMSLWAMGFSLLNYPKEVVKGYKKGLRYNNLLSLNIPKQRILNLSIEDINKTMLKSKPQKLNAFIFSFWCFISLTIFFFPLIIIAFAIFYFMHAF